MYEQPTKLLSHRISLLILPRPHNKTGDFLLLFFPVPISSAAQPEELRNGRLPSRPHGIQSPMRGVGAGELKKICGCTESTTTCRVNERISQPSGKSADEQSLFSHCRGDLLRRRPRAFGFVVGNPYPIFSLSLRSILHRSRNDCVTPAQFAGLPCSLLALRCFQAL